MGSYCPVVSFFPSVFRLQPSFFGLVHFCPASPSDQTMYDKMRITSKENNASTTTTAELENRPSVRRQKEKKKPIDKLRSHDLTQSLFFFPFFQSILSVATIQMILTFSSRIIFVFSIQFLSVKLLLVVVIRF